MNFSVIIRRRVLLAIFTSLASACSNSGKKAKISISNPSGIYDLCVTINSDGKNEAKSVPYTYTASEGETVSITAFTSSSTVATGSVTTYMTNDCENEVTYSAKVYNGNISIEDDYEEVLTCKDKNDNPESTL